MTQIMIPAWIDGTLTPVEKLDAHKRGLRHKAVSVFVLTQGAILIQRRALGKYHTPGLWANTCCTHPQWDETDALCAQRRLQEELAITGVTPLPRGQVEYRADVGGGLIELSVVPNPNEVMDIRWVTPAQLNKDIATQPELFTPWLSIYMAEHGTMIFGTGACI